MNRLSIGLVLIVGILAGGLGVSLLNRGPAPLGDGDVRGIVADMLAADKAETPPALPAPLDPAELNVLIEDYLMSDPGVLQRVADKLADEKRAAQLQAQQQLIAANYDAIYSEPGDVILGNPDGDVTLVEMFDYNCGYCRQALPDLATLIAEDSNLKVILKEFPILSEGSIEAAKVAVLVNEDKSLDYWDFHQKLFASRGQIGAEAALTAAEAVGANRVALMIDMNGAAAMAPVRRSHALAETLNISGTPTFIIGNEVIPGAIGLNVLRAKIRNMRECGSTICGSAG